MGRPLASRPSPEPAEQATINNAVIIVISRCNKFSPYRCRSTEISEWFNHNNILILVAAGGLLLFAGCKQRRLDLYLRCC